MLQQESQVVVADNSGAKRVKIFKVLGGSKRRYAHVGDTVICSVRDADPNSAVKKGQVVRGVIVATSDYVRRADGSKIRWDRPRLVLIDDKGNPKGTRIFGSVAREVKDRGYAKICSLAPEVI